MKRMSIHANIGMPGQVSELALAAARIAVEILAAARRKLSSGDGAVAAELACGREFTEAMSDHILGNEHLREYLAIVDEEGVTDHIRCDHGASRPRFYWPFLACIVEPPHLFLEVLVHERAFFN
jgi:hypothetical protein